MPMPRLRLLLPLGLAAACACAHAAPTVEELKAQVLARVLLFVRWSGDEAAAPRELALCVTGRSPLDRALAALDDQPVNEHRLRVRRVALEQLGECRIAYLGEADLRALPALAGKPVLTVTDTQGQLERGAMLALQLDGTRVGFDIGLSAARAAGIEFSAKLLRLARYVRDE